MRNLSDTTVVITGASSSIGYAAALAFTRAGTRVALITRHADALQDTLAAERSASKHGQSSGERAPLAATGVGAVLGCHADPS